MECKKINSYLLITVIILLFMAILVLIKILLSDFKGFEWGSVTDWVSALCNVAMASAAVYAALQAKKWFLQNKKIKSLSSSHQLAMKFELLLWEINSRIFNDTLFRAKVTNDIHNKIKSKEELLSLITSEINKNLTSDLEELAILYTTKSMLSRFNIVLSEKLENDFYKILELRKEYLNHHYLYLATIKKHIDDIEHHDVKTILEKLNHHKKILAEFFQNDMCKNNINRDYEFN